MPARDHYAHPASLLTQTIWEEATTFQAGRSTILSAADQDVRHAAALDSYASSMRHPDRVYSSEHM